MLAIHNYKSRWIVFHFAANAFAKLSKCQQFTTNIHLPKCLSLLQTLLQSYQNVSNSQRWRWGFDIRECCKRFCKVIKMLAIHNIDNIIIFSRCAANAFAKLSKCQQFTTAVKQVKFLVKLQTLLQSYQNVSNSQLAVQYIYQFLCCKRFCKVIKMLAIHN